MAHLLRAAEKLSTAGKGMVYKWTKTIQAHLQAQRGALGHPAACPVS
jgi:hypothetical protein